MKFASLILIIMVLEGCGWSGSRPPRPYQVQVTQIGSIYGEDADAIFSKFALNVDVSTRSQVKDVSIKVNTPNAVEIDECDLFITERDKLISKEKVVSQDPHTVMWSGDIHPKKTFWERLFKINPKFTKSLSLMLKTRRSDLGFKEKFKVTVILHYYDVPNALPDFEPSGSSTEVIEFGAEAWEGRKHSNSTGSRSSYSSSGARSSEWTGENEGGEPLILYRRTMT